VLELSATPADRPKDTPPIHSNWLVDVRGTAPDQEAMIKLPINVTVRGDNDWRDCLRADFEYLNGLQEEADRLQAESSRRGMRSVRWTTSRTFSTASTGSG